MSAPRYRRSRDHEIVPARVEDGMPTNEEYRTILSTGDTVEPEAMDRRTFLKAAGFSAAALAVAGCGRAPLARVVPAAVQTEETVPGVAAWYASLCGGCDAGCGILVKNRDGRPIKIEGNPSHPMSKGGLCAAGQAMVLSLYDEERLRNPLLAGARADWREVDAHVMRALADAREHGRTVALVTRGLSSPSAIAAVESFTSLHRACRHVEYDPMPLDAIAAAHEATHGARILPRYRFELAEVIVAFEADFLGAWISPVEHAAGYRAGRELVGAPKMSWHAQIESRLSLTGSNADLRVPAAPEALLGALSRIAREVSARVAGPAIPAVGDVGGIPTERIMEIVDRLVAARGKSLVVCGVNELGHQILVNAVNSMLGNYGVAVDAAHPSLVRNGRGARLIELIEEMERGRIGVLMIREVNPAYDHPLGARFAEAVKKVACVVSFAPRVDETAALAGVVAPEHHPLEGWRDAEPVSGVVTMGQPVIAPMGATRSFVESVAAWSGVVAAEYDLVREAWRRRVYPRAASPASFDEFWTAAVHDGVASLRPHAPAITSFKASALSKVVPRERTRGEFALTLYAKPAMPDAMHAHNPWLLELPDPMTKIVWDNYLLVSPRDAHVLGVRDGDVVRVESAAAAVELPAFVQLGQADGAVAAALCYGREGTGRFALVGPQWLFAKPTVDEGSLVGVNVAPLGDVVDGFVVGSALVSLSPTGRRRELVSTQKHHLLALRNALGMEDANPSNIIEETTFAAFAANPGAGGRGEEPTATLWPDDHRYDKGPRWGMVVDLSACTGCSACVVACQAENNVPVVGRDEAARGRIMHWMRVDRYYAGEDENPDVVHQPMTCHHCHNAPCEVVCPALATVHSAEGLNQQVYNRCIGTRYCANNCPYKVRRFNWFDYPREDRLRNMQLNPDVTVRTRGVMEKCTFCVQRIAAAKADAARRGDALKDGDVLPACAQSCPSRAIIFGDMADPSSAVSKAMADPRRYVALGELNLRPGLAYLRLVRNRHV